MNIRLLAVNINTMHRHFGVATLLPRRNIEDDEVGLPELPHDGRSSVRAGDHGAARVEPAFPGPALDGAQDRIGPNHPEPGRSRHLADVLLVGLGVQLELARLLRKTVRSNQQPCPLLGHPLRILEIEVIRTDGQAEATELCIGLS